MSKEKIKLKDKIREQLRLMLSLDVTPHKMALACALGMIVGISPYVGFQTYIAIAFASIFRVPIYPLIIGVYITNPLTIPFIFTLTTKFGMWLLNIHIEMDFDWHNINLRELWNAGKALLVPFLLGTHVIGIIFAVFTYPIVYIIMKLYKKKPAASDIKTASAETKEADRNEAEKHHDG